VLLLGGFMRYFFRWFVAGFGAAALFRTLFESENSGFNFATFMLASFILAVDYTLEQQKNKEADQKLNRAIARQFERVDKE